MPACPYRSWSASDSDCKARPDTIAAKEMDDKLKRMMADRDALDQRLITPISTSLTKKVITPLNIFKS